MQIVILIIKKKFNQMTITLLIIIPVILSLWAQSKISTTYNKWIHVQSKKSITGAETAIFLMKNAGIHDVKVIEISGHLTDYYDPLNKCLALSNKNYNSSSLAAIGVAAHEAGHAIQHKEQYTPLQIRSALIPITNIASQLLPFIITGGFLFSIFGLIKIGVLAYLILTIFQVITLPVEFDASKRAKKQLLNLGIIEHNEQKGVIQTLDAAAMTYVAAFISSLANLLHFFLLSRDSK